MDGPSKQRPADRIERLFDDPLDDLSQLFRCGDRALEPRYQLKPWTPPQTSLMQAHKFDLRVITDIKTRSENFINF